MSLPQLVDTLLRRQRRVFIAVFLAGVVAAGIVIFALPKQYEATATLFVGENRPLSPDSNAVQLDEVLARTYSSLLDTPSVSNDVLAALPSGVSARELDEKVDFEVVTGTRLIDITGTDQTAGGARTLANTYAQTFVRNQQRSAVGAARTSLDDLNARIARLVRERDALRGSTAADAAGRVEQIENQLAAARDSYSVTQQNISLQGSNVSVASLANLPTQPAKPRPKLYALLGVVFSFFLAVAAALLRNIFDKRVRDEDELVELLGVPILTRVPRLASGGEQAFSEAFDFLRLNLQLRDGGRAARVLAVTSALPGDGKSRVVASLSRALALSGSRVIAVDSDLRKPMLASYLGVDSKEGLTSVIVGKRDPTELLRPAAGGGVRVLASGPLPPNPSVIVSTSAYRRMVARLREEASYVVIDTPPVTGGAETSVVTSTVDGVIFVVDLDQSRRDTLIAAKDQLDRAGGRLLGLVVNRVQEGVGVGAYYGYGYAATATATATAMAGQANGTPNGAAARRGTPA